LTVPKYMVPYGVVGWEELTGTMRCGNWKSVPRVMGQVDAGGGGLVWVGGGGGGSGGAGGGTVGQTETVTVAYFLMTTVCTSSSVTVTGMPVVTTCVIVLGASVILIIWGGLAGEPCQLERSDMQQGLETLTAILSS
jgi:hypothetical protein